MKVARKRTRQNMAFMIRLILFSVIFCCVCALTIFLVTPKDDYGAGSMLNFYAQPKDTVDVLALGTSMTYAGVNTNVLWANWGYSAYDLACAEQQYWNTYYYLKEALKTQHPKVILLDAKPATYQDGETKRGRTIMSTFGILSPDNRIEAIRVTAGTQWLDYVLGFPQIHDQWKELTLSSFTAASWTGGRSVNWKGFVEKGDTERHDKPSLVWTDIKRSLNAREEEYFLKICDLAEKNGIALLLVAYPNPDYASDHMFYNALWALADERAVPHLNLNDPKGHYKFLYSKEFADWQHVNTLGSLKLSKILGTYLQKHYNLTDHRGDEAYETWGKCLAEWETAWPQYVNQIKVEGST